MHPTVQPDCQVIQDRRRAVTMGQSGDIQNRRSGGLHIVSQEDGRETLAECHGVS